MIFKFTKHANQAFQVIYFLFLYYFLVPIVINSKYYNTFFKKTLVFSSVTEIYNIC